MLMGNVLSWMSFLFPLVPPLFFLFLGLGRVISLAVYVHDIGQLVECFWALLLFTCTTFFPGDSTKVDLFNSPV